jgi:hypothetical protein
MKYKKIRKFQGKRFYLFSDTPFPTKKKAEEAKNCWAFKSMGYHPEFKIVKVSKGYLLYWR